MTSMVCGVPVHHPSFLSVSEGFSTSFWWLLRHTPSLPFACGHDCRVRNMVLRLDFSRRDALEAVGFEAVGFEAVGFEAVGFEVGHTCVPHTQRGQMGVHS